MAPIVFILLLATYQTTMATQDWVITLNAKINGTTADKVWPYIADFCNVYKIYPAGTVSYCVKGTPGRPGLTRYIVEKTQSSSNPNAFESKWEKEELIHIDAAKRSETHKMLENNKGLTRWVATVQILPVDNKSCTFKWSIVCAPIPGLDYKVFVGKLELYLASIASSIQKLF